jgi:hypothetical protein
MAQVAAWEKGGGVTSLLTCAGSRRIIFFWTNVAVHHRSARGNAGNHGADLLGRPQPATAQEAAKDVEIT